jgi:hypothetical protein
MQRDDYFAMVRYARGASLILAVIGVFSMPDDAPSHWKGVFIFPNAPQGIFREHITLDGPAACIEGLRKCVIRTLAIIVQGSIALYPKRRDGCAQVRQHLQTNEPLREWLKEADTVNPLYSIFVEPSYR